MSKRKRYLLIILGLVLAIAVAFSFRPQPAAVSVAQVARGPLQVTVEQEGKTRVRERYVVSAPVPGYAPRLDKEVGDPVKAGEVLLSLRPTPSALLDPRARAEAEARVSQAEANLEAAQSRLTAAEAGEHLASAERDRAEALVKRGDISRSGLDQAVAEARQAEANLRAARFAVNAARGDLKAAQAAVRYYHGEDQALAMQDIPVRAPVSGSVLSIRHKSQGVVQAGESLLTVGDTRLLEVEVDVLSADAVRIHPGMRVLFERWGGAGDLKGRVRTVEPAGFTKVSALGVEEQRVWVIADIVSPPEQWRTLGDRYRVEAKFILWSSDDVLKVPASALFRQGEGWAAFVIENGRAHKRPVQVGHRGELEVEVIGGLQAGDQVITHPEESLTDGARVEARSG